MSSPDPSVGHTQGPKQGTEVHSPGFPASFLVQGNVYNPGFISVVSPNILADRDEPSGTSLSFLVYANI